VGIDEARHDKPAMRVDESRTGMVLLQNICGTNREN
jgi:hypothetical protein